MQALEANGYSIHFNENGYKTLNEYLQKNNFSGIYLLTDSNTHAFCATLFLSQIQTELPIEIIELEAGEEMKNIESCAELWSTLNDLGADRKSLIINLGGGVITDLGGFVAATYKRGISFVHVPTTLLGMVDAAVGGKNGVDLGNLKNQIGVIVPPDLLLIDTRFLNTLPPRQMRSGLAEMLKHGLIFDENYWNAFQNLSGTDSEELDQLIWDSISIKNQVVLQDPTENGIRKILNFGHTLGHAIESYFLNDEETPLLHGEAIAIGMILEAHLSWQQQLLSWETYQEIKTRILDIFDRVEISVNAQLDIIGLLQYDKKNEHGKVLFVLLERIGQARIDQILGNDMILSAFQDYHS